MLKLESLKKSYEQGSQKVDIFENLNFAIIYSIISFSKTGGETMFSLPYNLIGLK